MPSSQLLTEILFKDDPKHSRKMIFNPFESFMITRMFTNVYTKMFFNI